MKSASAEAVSDAGFYAQQLMEEIRSKKFDKNASAPWSSGADFGPDAGQTRSGTGGAGFDDVDDYNGYQDIPAAGYTRCVTVDYVTPAAGSWNGTCFPGNPVSCSAPACASANVTDYKRIIVRVSRNDNLVKDLTLTTVVGPY